MTYRKLHGWAVATATVTFLLIVVGGIVHSTGSSLACPDWPTCYGTLNPPMVGGIFFEHGHRLLGAAVGLLTVGFALLAWFEQRRSGRLMAARAEASRTGTVALLLRLAKVRWLGAIAVAAVILQGLLGGLTVILRLPPAVSTAHLALSMIFLSTMVTLVVRTRSDFLNDRPATVIAPASRLGSARRWLMASIAVVYFQLVLGAAVRHTGASLACLDIPTCRGTLWPFGGGHLLAIQLLHRWSAVAVAIVIGIAVVKVWQGTERGSTLRSLVTIAVALVLCQIALGLLAVVSLLSLPVVVGHLAVGAALLQTLVVARLRLLRPGQAIVGRVTVASTSVASLTAFGSAAR